VDTASVSYNRSTLTKPLRENFRAFLRTPRVLQAKYLLERKIFRTSVLRENETYFISNTVFM
jgi:hypothetical protein